MRFLTFLESGSLCAAAMSLSSISTPIREPISLTICLGLSWDVSGTPVISKLSLLKYCCVSSSEHSIRSIASTYLSIVPASSPYFCSIESEISLYFLSSLAVWPLDFCMLSITVSYFFEINSCVVSFGHSVDTWLQRQDLCFNFLSYSRQKLFFP